MDAANIRWRLQILRMGLYIGDWRKLVLMTRSLKFKTRGDDYLLVHVFMQRIEYNKKVYSLVWIIYMLGKYTGSFSPKKITNPGRKSNLDQVLFQCSND